MAKGLLNLLIAFTFLSLSLSFEKAMAAPTCKHLFLIDSSAQVHSETPNLLQKSEALENDFLTLKKSLDTKNAYSANDVRNLNHYFNEWLKVTESKLNLIHSIMGYDSLPAAERLNTLEIIRSVYQSYFNVIHPMYENTKWRRILNRADQDRTENSFGQLQNAIFSKELFNFYRDLMATTNRITNAEIPVTFYTPEKLQKAFRKIYFKKNVISLRDFLRRSFENALHIVTESIGITSDTFPLRRGRLADRPEVEADFVATLRPMDILMDRANRFKLSHMIIPGYYGHGGIYLGTKAQLIELGLWNDPRIIPYQKQIEEGFVMLEAKRTGVRLRKLSEYLNTDTVTGLRQRNVTAQNLLDKMAWGLSQIGKTFDHTFDLEHTESYFCSKLIYFIYNDVPWPSRRAPGRYAVPPDYIASMSLGPNRYFDPVLVYQNGQKVTSDLQQHIESVQRNIQ